MVTVEPIPNERAAIVETGSQRVLAIADYHAGIETVLRSEGVELDSRAPKRRERLLELLAQTAPDRLVVLGDLVHTIGEPWEEERAELTRLFDALAVPVTLVKGNHDGVIEEFLGSIDHDITVTGSDGIRLGDVGFAHGHTWPSRAVLEASILCIGHEHPVVRLEDEVGGSRVEEVWLRGNLDSGAFEDLDADKVECELVVFPAFNELSGGTWINVAGQEFLVPFLPEGLVDGEAYLLDGTRLGSYRTL